MSVLSRDYGLHILKNHEAFLFKRDADHGRDNIRICLWKDKYLSEPLPLDLGKGKEHFFCLADNKCFRHLANAALHFKGKKEKHKEAVLAFREKYPLDPNEAPLPRVSYGLTDKQKEKIQAWMLFTIKQDEQDNLCFSNAERKAFDEIGIETRLENLKEMFPNSFPPPEPQDEEEPPAEEEQPPEETPAEEELPPEEPPLAEEEEATPLPLPERVVEPPPPPPPMTATPVMARRQSFHPSEMQSLYTFAMRPQPQAFPNLIVNTKQMKR
jgi:hypothetical protein